MKRRLLYTFLVTALGSLQALAQQRELHLYYADLYTGSAAQQGMSPAMSDRIRRQIDSLVKKPSATVAFFRVGLGGKLATEPSDVQATFEEALNLDNVKSTNESHDCSLIRDYIYEYAPSSFKTVYVHMYMSKTRMIDISSLYSPFYHYFLEELTTSTLADRYQIEIIYPQESKSKEPINKGSFEFLARNPSFRNYSAQLSIFSL